MTEETLKKAITLSERKKIIESAILRLDIREDISIGFLRIEKDSETYKYVHKFLEKHFKELLEQTEKSIAEL